MYIWAVNLLLGNLVSVNHNMYNVVRRTIEGFIMLLKARYKI